MMYRSYKAQILNNYPVVEEADAGGYWLISKDDAGNILKKQYCKYRYGSENKNMDYTQFDATVKDKKAQGKFFAIAIGENASYIFDKMMATTQINNFSKDVEDVWVVYLKGIENELEKKQWTFGSLAIFDQFKIQNIQEGDKIRISREPHPTRKDASRYKIEKLLIQ